MKSIALPIALSTLAVLLLLTGESAATGAADLAGRWTASGISSKWVEGEWGAHCGKKPATGGGSGSVVISSQGSELRITGGGRSYTTNQCWTTEPGMSVTAHTAGARNWKTVCQLSGARKVTIATTLNATSDTITFYETGQYQFMSGGKPCTASVGRYRTYKLVQPADTPKQAEPTASKEEKKETEDSTGRCTQPGKAVRVDIEPERRLVSPGDTFAFTAKAYDKEGCRVRRRPAWAVEGGGSTVEVDSTGKVAVASDASETEVDVRATFGAVSATARLEVASKERIEALLGRGDSESAPLPTASAAVASKSLGAEDAVAEDRASGRKLLFLGLLGVVAVGLGLAGVVILRRAKKQSADAALRRTGPDSVPRSSRRREPSSRGAPRSAPQSQPQASPGLPSPGEPMKKMCPMCGRQYPERSQFWGQDGASLIPLN